jgi:gluconate:H+ symporter, GntP family
MHPTSLVLLGVAAVGAILFLIIRLRVHPFLTLLIVSACLGLAGGIPIGEVFPILRDGAGATLGGLALLVALGAMLGAIVEAAGGAESIARAAVNRLGPDRAQWAVAIASFLFGIPVFVDVGTIVLAPVVLAIARAVDPKGSVLRFALPSVLSLLIVHCILPPHPGAVAGVGILRADVGMVLLLGLPIALVSWFVVQHLTHAVVVRVDSDAREPAMVGGSSSAGEGPVQNSADERAQVGGPFLPLLFILMPMILIMLQTVPTLFGGLTGPVAAVFSLVGDSTAALLITVMCAGAVLGRRSAWTLRRLEQIVSAALPAVAAVILITGAGGAFGRILSETGVGAAIADSLSGTGMPVLLMAWVLSVLSKAAQGSSTVATMTTAPLILPLLDGFTPLQVALVAIAIGAGSIGPDHVNSSLFWIWSRTFGVSVSVALRTYTLLTVAASVVALAATAAGWILLSMVDFPSISLK